MSSIFASWRDSNAQATYPFLDHADPTTTAGRTLPRDVIVDASLHLPGDIFRYWLAAIEFLPNFRVKFTLESDSGGSMSGVFSENMKDFSAVALLNAAGSVHGTLVVNPDGVRALIGKWEGEPQHRFIAGTSELVPHTYSFIEPVLVQAVTRSAGTSGVTVPEAGDVYFVAQHGARFTKISNTEFQVHAIGDPLANRLECEETFDTPRYIQQVVVQKGEDTIEVNPGDYGEIYLLAGPEDRVNAAFQMQPRDSTLTFKLLDP